MYFLPRVTLKVYLSVQESAFPSHSEAWLPGVSITTFWHRWRPNTSWSFTALLSEFHTQTLHLQISEALDSSVHEWERPGWFILRENLTIEALVVLRWSSSIDRGFSTGPPAWMKRRLSHQGKGDTIQSEDGTIPLKGPWGTFQSGNRLCGFKHPILWICSLHSKPL